MSKRCPSCEQTLSASEFGRNRSLPDGLSFYCLSCNRARNNRWYRERRHQQGKEVRDLTWVPEGFRWCPSCRQAVPHDQYTRNTRKASGFGSRCKACKSAEDRAGYFYRRYKLTRQELATLRASQGDQCAICGETQPQHLDHDHATGLTRQYLCQRCNNGLGLFKDDPRVLRAAADYVEEHRRRQRATRPLALSAKRLEVVGRPGRPPVGSGRRPAYRRTGLCSRGRATLAAREADE